jgi:outer membrane PBP1 activator LpoA protein
MLRHLSIRLLVIVPLLCALLLNGCATTTGGPVSLQEVREFADASARLGGYAELARRYRDTYEREQPYLSPAADKLARENDAKRKAVHEDFIAIQKTLVLYMQTLSLLAGDARYDLSERIDDLGNGL